MPNKYHAGPLQFRGRQERLDFREMKREYPDIARAARTPEPVSITRDSPVLDLERVIHPDTRGLFVDYPFRTMTYTETPGQTSDIVAHELVHALVDAQDIPVGRRGNEHLAYYLTSASEVPKTYQGEITSKPQLDKLINQLFGGAKQRRYWTPEERGLLPRMMEEHINAGEK